LASSWRLNVERYGLGGLSYIEYPYPHQWRYVARLNPPITLFGVPYTHLGGIRALPGGSVAKLGTLSSDGLFLGFNFFTPAGSHFPYGFTVDPD